MNEPQAMNMRRDGRRLLRGLALGLLLALAATLAVFLLIGAWQIFISVEDGKTKDYFYYFATIWNRLCIVGAGWPAVCVSAWRTSTPPLPCEANVGQYCATGASR